MADQLHEKLGPNGATEELYFILGISNAGGVSGKAGVCRLRCAPDLPPDESPTDWAEWNREVYRAARYLSEEFSKTPSRWTDQADGVGREDDPPSIASGLVS